MQEELVSIITPLYNGERFVAQTIESVLAQTYKNWEMIIINDGSKDNSEEIAKAYSAKDGRIKVFSQDEEYNIICVENQTILSALESNNIPARSRCKNGKCGYCRSLLLWGTVRIEEGLDKRRKADIKFNYIHPCCTYPTSDITIKIDI